MKIPPVAAEVFFFQTKRQADVKKLIIAFRNFANAPKNEDSQRPNSGDTWFLVTHIAFASAP